MHGLADGGVFFEKGDVVTVCRQVRRGDRSGWSGAYDNDVPHARHVRTSVLALPKFPGR